MASSTRLSASMLRAELMKFGYEPAKGQQVSLGESAQTFAGKALRTVGDFVAERPVPTGLVTVAAGALTGNIPLIAAGLAVGFAGRPIGGFVSDQGGRLEQDVLEREQVAKQRLREEMAKPGGDMNLLRAARTKAIDLDTPAMQRAVNDLIEGRRAEERMAAEPRVGRAHFRA